MRMAGYIRVSRTNQRKGEGFMSPDQQRDSIAGWAAGAGAEIVWFEEMNVSGSKNSRPRLDAMLAEIKAGRLDGMVVARLDRASRSASGGLALIKSLSDQGKRFVSVADNVDPNTRNGRLLFGILLVLAEWELEGRTEGWADATARVNERGVHQGNAYGYERIKGKPLVANPAESPGVKLAFAMREARASWKDIADELLAQGFRPRRAETWGTAALSHMLGNRVYLGEATQGEMVREAAHPAIVDRELFAAVQARKGSSHAKTAEWLLSGLMRCQVCRGKARGAKPGTYRCRESRHVNTSTKLLDLAVSEAALTRHDFLLEGVKRGADITVLNAAVAAAEAELVAYSTMTAAAGRPDLFKAGLQERGTALADAERKRDNALSLYSPMLTESLRGKWEAASVADRNKLLRGLIDFVIIHPTDGHTIVWRGQGASLGAVPKTGGGQGGDAPRAFPPFAWPVPVVSGVELRS